MVAYPLIILTDTNFPYGKELRGRHAYELVRYQVRVFLPTTAAGFGIALETGQCSLVLPVNLQSLAYLYSVHQWKRARSLSQPQIL